ncbi:MAG: hypothetical protein JNJ78_21255, partial [Anaerolineae bacterium]|nr:hypothetical protein [Anaerolineae bacterium]
MPEGLPQSLSVTTTTTTTNAPLGGNLGAFPPVYSAALLPLLLQNPCRLPSIDAHLPCWHNHHILNQQGGIPPMKAIRIHQHGGPEVLQTVELPLPALLPDCVLVRNQAVGVNYVDVQHRQGGYYPVQ